MVAAGRELKVKQPIPHWNDEVLVGVQNVFYFESVVFPLQVEFGILKSVFPSIPAGFTKHCRRRLEAQCSAVACKWAPVRQVAQNSSITYTCAGPDVLWKDKNCFASYFHLINETTFVSLPLSPSLSIVNNQPYNSFACQNRPGW